MIVEITTEREYQICRERGYEPLIDKRFVLPIRLRYDLQNQMFNNDVEYYRYAYKIHPTKCCEECGKPLNIYRAMWVSHILSRGAHPEARYDLRNYNLLCYDHHTQWERTTSKNGKNRYEMSIYKRNQPLMEQMIAEYRALKEIPQFD